VTRDDLFEHRFRVKVMREQALLLSGKEAFQVEEKQMQRLQGSSRPGIFEEEQTGWQHGWR
jgi:hypothetical protein